MNNVLKAQSFAETHLGNPTGLFSSVPNGKYTLYGTCYTILTKYYFDQSFEPADNIKKFISDCQVPTGEFIGPELQSYDPSPDSNHNREHLLLHSTNMALPVCIQFNIPVRYPLHFSHHFCDINYLDSWLRLRDFSNAWLEGNNLLFIGQLLVYLRDYEKYPGANHALDYWFNWLDNTIDPKTGLWGTNGYCSPREAVYGGYHQLLVYYHENHSIVNPRGLVDNVLTLQHKDGGFHPRGNGGACEDVDCVDILVNMYKRVDYRRRDIRIALRRCLSHILSLQNADGGFPYNRDKNQSHMNIPGTSAPPNLSTAFATWFRVHTIALIKEVLPIEPRIKMLSFGFTNNLSMGWHQPWDLKTAAAMSGYSEIFEQLYTRVLELFPNLLG